MGKRYNLRSPKKCPVCRGQGVQFQDCKRKATVVSVDYKNKVVMLVLSSGERRTMSWCAVDMFLKEVKK